MAEKITKRKKKLRLTIILFSIFIVVLSLLIWIFNSNKNTYKPGEEIEGLTSDLARNLPKDYPKITFSDATKEANISFDHFIEKRTTQLPEDMGSGVAWGDYDNDGWQDLLIVNFSGSIDKEPTATIGSKLYHNEQNGTFRDVTKESGLSFNSFGNAAVWVDINNDGWQDAIITNYGKNMLYINNGDGTFQDQSEASGIGVEDGFWTGIACGDYNKDGYVDLYICGYVDYEYHPAGETSNQYNAAVPVSLNPSSFVPVKNVLYQNNQDGTFTDVTEQAGVTNEQGRSLSAVWSDLDEDGWQDLYVANDVSDNVLYKNNGDGTFAEISHPAFVADYRGAMGIAVGDWNNDEDLDMFITHWIAQENALYSNMLSQLKKSNPNGEHKVKFMDEADRFGLGQIAIDFIGFGTQFFDYNNDGRLDIFVTNGSTFEEQNEAKNLIAMKDQLFWNRDNESGFYDVSLASGKYFQEEWVGRGSAFADYDNDGDLDLVVNNNCGPVKLLRNDKGNDLNWLQIKLQAEDNSFIGGAKIKLISANGSQVREVGTEGSYLSQNSWVQHFGLKDITKVDTVQVTWPSGNVTIKTDLPVNQIISISTNE